MSLHEPIMTCRLAWITEKIEKNKYFTQNWMLSWGSQSQAPLVVAASNGELPSYQFQEKSWLRSSSSGYQTRWTKRSWRNKWGSGKERVAPTRSLLFKHHQVTHRVAVESILRDSLLYWILQQIFHHCHHHHHFISHFLYNIYTGLTVW